MTAVTISPKFQVVIPASIRRSMKLVPGQQVEAIEYEGRIELIPVKPASAYRGSLTGIDTEISRDIDRV